MKKWLRCLFIFVFAFCIYEFFGFSNTYGDPLNNYVFSHAIVQGEIPYLDFNIISTPLYTFVMATGLFFFDNYLMFIIEQSLLVTILFYFLFEMYGKKSYLVLLCICLFSFLGINATYNFLVLLFLVILLYLEKRYPNKDYLIGFIIGCAILSKHTSGVFLILPSIIYYFRDFKKLLRRAIGVFIPCIVFVIYLLCNRAFYPFINLCVLGLLDFSSENGQVFSLFFFLSILLFIIQLFIAIKYKKDIRNCYLIMGFSFMIPLFDFHHFAIYAICFVIQILEFISVRNNYFYGLVCFLSVFFSLLLFVNYCILLDPVISSRIPRFQYTLCPSDDYQKSVEFFQFFDQYENKLILSYGTLQYKASRGEDISYFDFLLYGNHGYDGSDNMIKKIQDMQGVYIIINRIPYEDDSKYNQFNKIILKHVMDSYEMVASWRDFNVYYKN